MDNYFITTAINFISSKINVEHYYEERVIYSKRENIKIITIDKTDDAIEKHYKSLQKSYQYNLEKSMKVGESIFGYFNTCIINVLKQI